MELTLTTVMMSVILIVAPVIILKKNTKPKTNVGEHLFIVNCEDNCIYNAKASVLTTVKNNAVKQEERYDYIRHSGRPYEIVLVGGGGAGTKNGCGGAGEKKTFKMFLLFGNKLNGVAGKYNGILTGYYLLEVGKGGVGGKSGKPSRICAITEEMANKSPDKISCLNEEGGEISGATVLAEAMGGITSNEGTLDNKREFRGEPDERGSGGKKEDGAKGVGGVITIR